MKKLVILFVLLLMVASFNGCMDDECDMTKINAIDVGFWAWGTVEILNPQGENIVGNYEGSPFRVRFFKEHCNGKNSDSYWYDYHLLSDGTLKKEGIGYWSFTMDNTEDLVKLELAAELGGGNLSERTAQYHDWKGGKIRAQMTISYTADENNEVNWYGGSAEIEFIE